MKNNGAGAKANMKRSKYDMLRADTTSKINHLEAVISAEKTRMKETEACLSQQIEETCKLKAALVQTQEQMEDQKHQWEEDKSRFLAEQAKTLNAHVIETQKILESNQKYLLGIISTMADALEKEKEERKTSTDSLMDRIRTLEEQLETTKKEKTNTNLSGQDDFPALHRDWPEPHTHPNQKGNKGTSNPQGTYAQMLSKTVWPKVSSSKRPAKWT